MKPNQNHHWEGPFFVPPTTSNALSRVSQSQSLYRWRAGVVTLAGSNVPPPQHYLFDQATVFTQSPDTTHLLVVGIDALTANVNDHTSWRPLSFEHVRTPAADRTYSSVVVLGSQRHLVASGSSWVPQLVPEIYEPRAGYEGPSKSATSAGLIGSLPVLIALAAFSGPETRLDTILTQSLRPGVWANHTYPRGGKLLTLLPLPCSLISELT